MHQCAVCLSESQDHAVTCPKCGADLTSDSTRARALKRIKESGRASMVRVITWHDCCPTCRKVEGAHAFDAVPALPVPGCSGAYGCRCQYEPVILEVSP